MNINLFNEKIHLMYGMNVKLPLLYPLMIVQCIEIDQEVGLEILRNSVRLPTNAYLKENTRTLAHINTQTHTQTDFRNMT